jgi:hypothetical protein
MSFHAAGTMTVVNDDGKKYTYKVETFGSSLVLTGPDGIWHYYGDEPPVLAERLKADIANLTVQLREKKATLKHLTKG